MMSEKRFEVDGVEVERFMLVFGDDGTRVVDNQTGKELYAIDVVDLLNEQQDIINELQSIINHCERKTGSGKKMKSEEPVYYNSNGLSPNRAFEQGLISKEEFIGFIKGNIIKYVVRCGKKGNHIEDIDKAISYLQLLKKIMRFDDG